MVSLLNQSVDEKGEVFRIGGDDFAILVSKYSKEKCKNLIDLIEKKCSERKCGYLNLSISLEYAIMDAPNTDIYDVLK